MGNNQQGGTSFPGKASSISMGRSKEIPKVRCVSPGPSVSSDSDIPYVPYTVNRPIGDSPKLPSKSPAHSLRASATPSPKSSPKPPRPKSYAGSTSRDIIVVKEGLPVVDRVEIDPDVVRLNDIPPFQPIMRGALNLPTIRDPEVLNRLNHKVVLQLCRRYQEHMRSCSEVVGSEQNALANRIREIDFAITTLMNLLIEKQKKYAKYSEQLGRTRDVSNAVKHCQKKLSETVTLMESLNKMLPDEHQLEPFVVMTG